MGVWSALVMVAPLRRNPLQPIFPYQRPVNLTPAEARATWLSVNTTRSTCCVCVAFAGIT
jgi:hypothetical protein